MQDLGQHLGEGDQALDCAGGLRRCVVFAVGQIVHPMHHANRQRLAARRATALKLFGLVRQETNLTIPMAVQVVFALFGKKLNRALISPSGLQSATDGKIIKLGIKHAGFAPELLRRVRIGV